MSLLNIETNETEVVIAVTRGKKFPIIAYRGKCYFFEDLDELYYSKLSNDDKRKILEHISMEKFKYKKEKDGQIFCKLYVNLNSNIPIEILEYEQTFSYNPHHKQLSILQGDLKCNSIWMSERQKLLQSTNPNLSEKYKIKREYFGDFNPKDIAQYPNYLGKGMEECVQLKRYYDMGLYNPSSSDYESEKIIMEILLETSKDECAVQECIKSPYCGGFYEKLQSGTLNEITERIEVSEIEGKIFPNGNGNHRLCLLKRLNSEEKIKANITVYEKIK